MIIEKWNDVRYPSIMAEARRLAKTDETTVNDAYSLYIEIGECVELHGSDNNVSIPMLCKKLSDIESYEPICDHNVLTSIVHACLILPENTVATFGNNTIKLFSPRNLDQLIANQTTLLDDVMFWHNIAGRVITENNGCRNQKSVKVVNLFSELLIEAIRRYCQSLK